MTEDDWVAGVFVSNNGVDMDLESHIACKLPDGYHRLYAHPAQMSEAEAIRLRREAFNAGVAWQKEMEAPPVAAPSGEAEKLGAWLSAALEDPIVCDEMKADIENWFKASTPPYPNGEALDWADLGARLKKKLADERIGLRDLEGKLGLSKSTLSRVCNGKHCTVKAYLAITAWLAPPSPIANEPKDAGSGEEQTPEDANSRLNAAYRERNQVVAALAKCFPSGVKKTAIDGWDTAWHNCVYIDLPTGQASWHFHDDDAGLFEGLPPYKAVWDGHSTPEKYERLARLKDAGSGEWQELTEGEQATVLADLRDTSMIWALADVKELHKAGYRITRIAPKKAKP